MVNFKIMIYKQEKQEINKQEIINELNKYYSKIAKKKNKEYIKFETKE